MALHDSHARGPQYSETPECFDEADLRVLNETAQQGRGSCRVRGYNINMHTGEMRKNGAVAGRIENLSQYKVRKPGYSTAVMWEKVEKSSSVWLQTLVVDGKEPVYKVNGTTVSEAYYNEVKQHSTKTVYEEQKTVSGSARTGGVTKHEFADGTTKYTTSGKQATQHEIAQAQKTGAIKTVEHFQTKNGVVIDHQQWRNDSPTGAHLIPAVLQKAFANELARCGDGTLDMRTSGFTSFAASQAEAQGVENTRDFRQSLKDSC
eukprot:NODE_768_length_1206_cov_111.863763_g728_i0.p1 GENE.NODE_768_length_1206_cov_111.863763_g728_i0~~NODE_768_length_1206_cov_111.863763_g728_i0.p1  ORF type:complete len:295 (-),score=39.98 NODE_768_length_1206_cov_111.863763_g728_i0:322-1107(-)